jgi:DNA-3-methyladenine glycosylase II
MTELAIRAEGPLDVAATLARYRWFGDDPTNAFAGDALFRAARVGGRVVPYEVRWSGPIDGVRLAVRVPGRPSTTTLDAIADEVRRLFGLGFDLEAFHAMARRDPVLRPLVPRLRGLRPTLAPTALEMLVGAIAAQQVNLAFAFRLRERVVRRYGAAARIARREVFAFPAPERLAEATIDELRAMQYSTRKAEYVIGVAKAIASGALDAAALREADDAAVVAALTSMRGLGRWTAEWFLARHLGRGAVCPAGDLAVRKAFVRFCGVPEGAKEDVFRERAAPWGEHQNVAIHWLLAGLRLDAKRPVTARRRTPRS